MTRLEDGSRTWWATTATERAAWDALLAEEPTADPLQSWAWSEAGMATGERWERLVVADDDGRLGAAVQWQLVSPVLGHPLAYAPHGPVWRRSDPSGPQALRALVSAMREQCEARGASAILVDPRSALRDEESDEGGDPSAAVSAEGFRATTRHVQMPTTRVLDLREGIEATRGGWDKDTRNLVRRAAREGVETEVVEADRPAAVESLHRLMVDVGSRGGFAPRSVAFLGAYGRHAGDRAFVCLGRWQGRVIAGALVGMVGDRAYYLFAGSLREPELRHANAPYAVMERLIVEAVARDAVSLDLCGVNEKDDPTADPRWEGLSSFKRGFGGDPLRQPPVHTIVLRPGVERIRAAGQGVRQRLARLRERAR